MILMRFLAGDEIIPTAVAGFISIWALDIRDRHQGVRNACLEQIYLCSKTSILPRKTGSGPKQMERKSWDNRAGVLCIIGNMVLVETDRGQQFANIDFGWVEEGPSVDTGRFPIPTGFRYLLDATSQKAEFYDLCWDANRVLYRHRAELKEQWCAMLVQRGAGNAFFWRDDAIVY